MAMVEDSDTLKCIHALNHTTGILLGNCTMDREHCIYRLVAYSKLY